MKQLGRKKPVKWLAIGLATTLLVFISTPAGYALNAGYGAPIAATQGLESGGIPQTGQDLIDYYEMWALFFSSAALLILLGVEAALHKRSGR